MASSDILINIVGEFQRKGFDQADRAFGKLEKSAKSLGRTLGITLSAAAIIGYSKKAVAAANADIKSQRLLAQSLKNVGLAYSSVSVEGFIQKLQKQTGILDDELRPAFAQLAQVTGSVKRSQELLALAFDISAGSGKDINSVVDILTRSFLGNIKGLKSLNLAYTDAQLKAMSFNDVVTLLTAQYAGQGAASISGFEGKMRLLSVAAQDASETIGVSLINALETLSKDNSIENTTKKMEGLSKATANNITAIAFLIDQIHKIPGAGVLGNIFGFIENRISFFSPANLVNMIKLVQGFQGMGNIAMSVSSQDTQKAMIASAKKAEMDATKRAKALAALQKKAELDRIKREKESQQLKRAGTVFDMENIQIVAALQGRISEEQRLRLIALLAINNDIADAAEKTTKAILALQAPIFQTLGVTITAGDNATTIIEKLIKAQTQIVLVNTGITSLPKAKNPFEDWDTVMKNIIKNLDTIADKITKMPSASTSATATSTTSISTPSGTTTTSSIAAPTGLGAVARGEYPRTAEVLAAVIASNYAPDLVTAALGMGAVSRGEYTANIPTPYSAGMGAFGRGEYGAPTVIVNVAGSVTAEADLAETVREYLFDYQKTGGDIRTSAVAI